MTDPNRNALWGRVLIEELVHAGVETVCVAPGSRSTPLTVACASHPAVSVVSLLDERSAAYFALGRAKRTGHPMPLVCTSGTAVANFHPAVVEADRARVPMVLLTADRPHELRDSGANQTIDQQKFYGDAVRWYHELPEPVVDGRVIRSARAAVSRAVSTSMGAVPGPVHLNVPLRKPLEPVEVVGDVPDDFVDRHPLAADGRDGPYVRIRRGPRTLDPSDLRAVIGAVEGAERGVLVAGPADPVDGIDAALAADLASATGFPLLADPLSGVRFGPVPTDVPLVGGYDVFTDRAIADALDPDVVIRFGASPTSTALREYVGDSDARTFVIDPTGALRDETFTASDLVVADPTWFADALVDEYNGQQHGSTETHPFERIESTYWDVVSDVCADTYFEGAILHAVFAEAPDPVTVFVSNSMPVRDADRFARPRDASLTVLGNRGASGIDGILSTAIGAGSATDDPLVLVIGDVAYHHDSNGLLALSRADVDATIVLIHNDGGGIFHKLPIAAFDPPFSTHFKTPHGLDFEPTASLYGFELVRVDDLESFRAAYRESTGSVGTQVIEVVVDAETSHRTRARVHERACEAAADVLR